MTIQQLNSWVMIYLTSSRDWDSWFLLAKSQGLQFDIWDYMNSDSLEESVLSTDSSRPAVSQIKQDATSVLDLEDDKLSCFDYLWEMYKKKKTVYKKIKQDLTHFCSYLHFTVNADILVYLIKNDDSLYQIMKALKNEYCMSIKMCWKDVLDCYIVLKWFLKNEDLVLWCDRWLKIYNDLKKTEVMKINVVKHDFFDVNKKIDFFIAGVYVWNYNKLNFKVLIIKFKKYYKINSCSKQLFSFWTSFASMLESQTQLSSDEKLISKSYSDNCKNNECSASCDQHSTWSRCYYFNPAVWSVNVNKDSKVWKKIDTLIAVNS